MGTRITSKICGLTAALLFAATPALADGQGQNSAGGATGSHRAAQDKSLDFAVDYDDMAKKNEERLQSENSEPEKKQGEDDEPLAAPGSYRAAQEQGVPEGVDWSRRLGKNWRMDPVALNRRQDGKQSDAAADVDDQVMGLEIRRPF